jgi:hypothetical protein
MSLINPRLHVGGRPSMASLLLLVYLYHRDLSSTTYLFQYTRPRVHYDTVAIPSFPLALLIQITDIPRIWTKKLLYHWPD